MSRIHNSCPLICRTKVKNMLTTGTTDLYIVFYELGLLVKTGGTLATSPRTRGCVTPPSGFEHLIRTRALTKCQLRHGVMFPRSGNLRLHHCPEKNPATASRPRTSCHFNVGGKPSPPAHTTVPPRSWTAAPATALHHITSTAANLQPSPPPHTHSATCFHPKRVSDLRGQIFYCDTETMQAHRLKPGIFFLGESSRYRGERPHNKIIPHTVSILVRDVL